MKKRFSTEKIIGFRREADAGLPVKELCRKYGFSKSLLLPVAEQVRRHERAGGSAPEGAGDGERPAEEAAGRASPRERGDQGRAANKVVSAPARRDLVRQMTNQGLSERLALCVVRVSRQRLSLCDAPGPQRRTLATDRRPGAAAQALRRRNDPTEAETSRTASELQARGVRCIRKPGCRCGVASGRRYR